MALQITLLQRCLNLAILTVLKLIYAWAIGMMLYAVLVGRTSLVSDNVGDLLLGILKSEPSFLLSNLIRSHSFLIAEEVSKNLPDYLLYRAPIYPDILYFGVLEWILREKEKS